MRTFIGMSESEACVCQPMEQKIGAALRWRIAQPRLQTERSNLISKINSSSGRREGMCTVLTRVKVRRVHVYVCMCVCVRLFKHVCVCVCVFVCVYVCVC